MKYRILWLLTLLFPVLSAAVIPDSAFSFTETESPVRPVLIIDAGHGGEDGGAVAPDGVLEGNLNLAVALRLRAIADFWGLNNIMTRESEDIEYPPAAQTLSEKKKADQNTRLALINGTPGAILLSIHQNIYPAQAPHGIQVFFGAAGDGERFAKLLQQHMTEQLCPDNRRVAEPIDEGIYLMRKAQCPSVLVECGFLSNPGDLENLENESYQTQLAAVMLASCLEYIRGTSL